MKRAVLDVAELVGSYGRFVSYPQAAEITSLSVRSLKRETPPPGTCPVTAWAARGSSG